MRVRVPKYMKWHLYHSKRNGGLFRKIISKYFTFSPNSEEPIKTVIRHLPPHTPAEGISNSLEDLGFNVIQVRQLTTNRGAPNGQPQLETLSLFLVNLARNVNSQQIFKLNSLNHIIIKVESQRALTGLTQCYNCQNFGHVCANCKQSPRYLWYGSGHLHRECPEKMNTECSPSCCSCTIVEERPHPASYRGCNHAKGEMQRTAKQAPKESSGKTIFSMFTSPQQSCAAALVKTNGNSNHRQPRQNNSICHSSVSSGSQFV
jgi:hypothetical protein